MARKNHGKNSPANYTTEYIHLPHRPDLARVTLEPMKVICINQDAAPWAVNEYTVRRFDDALLNLIRRQL